MPTKTERWAAYERAKQDPRWQAIRDFYVADRFAEGVPAAEVLVDRIQAAYAMAAIEAEYERAIDST